MPTQGLSHLLVAIMAAADVPALWVSELRLAHASVARLFQDDSASAQALLLTFGVFLSARPDPEVGLRIKGMTQAVSEAVREGVLEPHEDHHEAWFSMPQEQRRMLRAQVARMDHGQSRLLYEVGAAWARTSTSRKNRRTNRSSPAISLLKSR